MISKKSLLRTPSAWIPIVMSLAALTLVFGYLAILGVGEPQEDEGAVAHLWQFLMGGQLPIIAYFAMRYLPKNPKKAIIILALQFIAGVIASAPVYILKM